MIKRHIIVGTTVKISKTCPNTKQYYGWLSNMDKYLGTEQFIEKVNTVSITIKKYLWHPDDLTKVIKKKTKDQFFDSKKIW